MAGLEQLQPWLSRAPLTENQIHDFDRGTEVEAALALLPPLPDAIIAMAKGLHIHGAAHLEAQEYAAESDFSIVALSVPSAGASTSRVLFVVLQSERNECDAGCWCAGTRHHSIFAFVPQQSGSRRIRLMNYKIGLGEATGEGYYEGFLAASSEECATVTQALSLEATLIGTLLRLVYISANVRGRGQDDWRRFECISTGNPEWSSELNEPTPAYVVRVIASSLTMTLPPSGQRSRRNR